MYKALPVLTVEAFNSANQANVEKEKERVKAKIYKLNNKHRIISNLKSAKILGLKDLIESHTNIPHHILRSYKVPELRAAGISNEKIKEIRKKKPDRVNENRTAIAQGRTFEKSVYNYIKAQKEKGYINATILYGIWIQYVDSNGLGYAQPDIVLAETGTNRLFIIECKRTQTDEAILQLEGLYKPLIRELFPQREIYLIQVFKNIVEKTDLIYNLMDYMRNPQKKRVNLQFFGE